MRYNCLSMLVGCCFQNILNPFLSFFVPHLCEVGKDMFQYIKTQAFVSLET